MADQQTDQNKPSEESKSDTVRINLPPGAAGRPGTALPVPPPPPSVRIQPGGPVSAGEEAKKETAVMGRPADVPRPKKDTSRVEVTAAKPAAPEMPKPTVKLRREPEPVPAAAPAPAPVAPVPMAVAPSRADTVLAVAAMLLSLAVLVSLALSVRG